MKKIIITIALLVSFSNASLKRFCGWGCKCKREGGTINTRDRTILYGGGYTMREFPNVTLTPFQD